MRYSTDPINRRARTLKLYKEAIDRIEDYLTDTNPEYEAALREEAITILFGPRPEYFITPWSRPLVAARLPGKPRIS